MADLLLAFPQYLQLSIQLVELRLQLLHVARVTPVREKSLELFLLLSEDVLHGGDGLGVITVAQELNLGNALLYLLDETVLFLVDELHTLV